VVDEDESPATSPGPVAKRPIQQCYRTGFRPVAKKILGASRASRLGTKTKQNEQLVEMPSETTR
jgi:hypothetical protein